VRGGPSWEWSFPDFDDLCRDWVHERFPDRNSTILDLGAGGGKYRNLFSDYPNMDAVEIWPAWIEEQKLQERYRRVFCADIRQFVPARYSLIVAGDCLEHIRRDEAVPLLYRLRGLCDDFLVSLPYMSRQGEISGNPHEAHQQQDLTRDLVLLEYPMLTLLDDNERVGIFVGRQ